MNGKIYGLPGQLKSQVTVRGGNGFGSSSTAIRRFANIYNNDGSDVNYFDSAVLGGTFVIATTGVYAIYFSDMLSSGSTNIGISRNTTAPNLSISGGSVPDTQILALGISASANRPGNVSWFGTLYAGDIIRAHTDGLGDDTTTKVQFQIVRLV